MVSTTLLTINNVLRVCYFKLKNICDFIHLFSCVIYSKHLFINLEEVAAKFPICFNRVLQNLWFLPQSVSSCIGGIGSWVTLNQDFYLRFSGNWAGNTWNCPYSNFYRSCCVLWIRGEVIYWLDLPCKHLDLCCESFQCHSKDVFSKFHLSVFSLFTISHICSNYICKRLWISIASKHTHLSWGKYCSNLRYVQPPKHIWTEIPTDLKWHVVDMEKA